MGQGGEAVLVQPSTAPWREDDNRVRSYSSTRCHFNSLPLLKLASPVSSVHVFCRNARGQMQITIFECNFSLLGTDLMSEVVNLFVANILVWIYICNAQSCMLDESCVISFV